MFSFSNTTSHFNQQLLELLWPTRCVGCNLLGELLCTSCRDKLPWISQRYACPICGAPYGWLSCTECLGDYIHRHNNIQEKTYNGWESNASISALDFTELTRRIVTIFKDKGELRLARLIADALWQALRRASNFYTREGKPRVERDALDALCFVPATKQAYARRGFDHMELVAKELEDLVQLPLFDVLLRKSACDQRKLKKEERKANLKNTIEVVESVYDMNFLLIDDVITTGSSVREASRALLSKGAHSVTVCSFARVW